jgi:phage terminase large subunit-like protein
LNPYVRAALAFAEDAVANTSGQHGQRIVKAARRFLRDYARQDAAWYFDPAYAFDACAFVEQMPHVEGQWATPNITLLPFQCFALAQLFGFRKRDPIPGATITLMGRPQPFRPRRFSSMLYATARKSAKSTMAAGIALYMLCREPEQGQKLYSAATTFKQALPIFGAAQRMVIQAAPIGEIFGVKSWGASESESPGARGVSCKAKGSGFSPMHAKASTQDGLNPSGCFIDEVHAHKTPDLINVLTSAAGARAAPFFGYFTTEGYISAGPWGEIRMFADKVLDGVFEADHHLVLFWSLDPDDEDFDESKWIKANPLMLTNPHLLSAIRKEAEEAKGMPSKLAEFRIKRLNRESNPPDAWIKLDSWEACDGEPVTPDDFDGLACYAGLDLASTTDLAAFRVVAEHPTRGLITWGRRWVPSDAVRVRTERGTVPYLGWTTAGLIEVIEGETIDTRPIKEAILEFDRAHRIEILAADPWNARQVLGELMEEGIEAREFVQGPKSYHPVMQEFERRYLRGQFAHGGDPVLKWCASNLIVRYDVNLNMAPDKKRAPEKIDDMVALLMALGAMMSAGDNDMSSIIQDPLHG